jgi:propanol-preferring alcohol dehydrogenase
MVLEKRAPADSGPLALRDVPLPSPGPGEIRLRVRACGVCHTDLHEAEGDLPLPKLPIILGHQVVGVVDALGPGTSDFREGDRVGVPWLYSTCGQCEYCLRGMENLCERARFTGLHADGGYAEAMIVPENFAVRLPKNYTDLEAAPLLCGGIVGYRAFRLSGARAGERLGLYGYGASAHIVLQVARYSGCEVYVFTRAEAHRQAGKEFLAEWAGGAEDAPPRPLDAAIIFAPAGRLALDALRATRKGGVVALAGVTMSPIPQMDYNLLYHERVLRSVANATRQDARDFLSLAAEIPVRTEIETFQLEDANRALQAVRHSRLRAAAVLKI